ncbi:probable pathogenesis-related protein ARB_02861 isoform X1 [Penaeus japonicus]|uniref:probable pathogenesis-related protein ARB_02861 isoform X1 n=1 Tax=Penaeus japonicus TaxID=27405 RepID=UPI001C716D95|nr:probable pathogenesis-related protein ARB_02861 isoform X1 [Penaeus japonicus]
MTGIFQRRSTCGCTPWWPLVRPSWCSSSSPSTSCATPPTSLAPSPPPPPDVQRPPSTPAATHDVCPAPPTRPRSPTSTTGSRIWWRPPAATWGGRAGGKEGAEGGGRWRT